MNTSRTIRKEKQRHSEVIDKLLKPLSIQIKEFKFCSNRARCFIPNEFEKSVESANIKYNKWAEKFNKKSTNHNAGFNSVRDAISREIVEHEINVFKDLVAKYLNENYGILYNVVEDNEGDIHQLYIKSIPVKQAAIFIKNK